MDNPAIHHRANLRIRTAAMWALALLFGPIPTRAQNLREDFWVPDGGVRAVCASESTLYLGGDFTRVGPNTGSAAAIDPQTGEPLQPYARVWNNLAPDWWFGGGRVNVVAADGSGGWYLGGTFLSVQGQARNGLAHMDAGGNLTTWNPNANGAVHALAVSGGVVYAGGEFTSVGGASRSYIAALDPATGIATTWNPGADGFVHVIFPFFSTIYVAGDFLNAGSQPRERLAALDASSGVPTAWNPGSSGSVYALALRSAGFPTTVRTLYVGGSFSIIGGQNRGNLAAFDVLAGSNSPTDWNPQTNGQVLALNVNGPTIYAGGRFTSVGGAAPQPSRRDPRRDQ